VQADQRSDFFHPYNPGNVLGYNPVTSSPRFSMFALYDPNNALREVLLTPRTGALYTGAIDPARQTTASYHNWLLNFDYTEGPIDTQWILGSAYPGVATDGNDMLFADLQHDWVVGGTGRDIMFLGFGDDLGQADDKLNTDNGLNDLADTNPSWEDFIFGGGGRDVLIGNTGGDRLVDWSGEFNSYMGPFSPFGQPTTSRTQAPALQAYVLALSRAAGADQTLAAIHGGSAARNGEPYGEIGEVEQQDPQSNDQKGGSRDPQPGPAHGTRDVRVFAGTQPIQAPGTGTRATAAAGVIGAALSPASPTGTIAGSDSDVASLYAAEFTAPESTSPATAPIASDQTETPKVMPNGTFGAPAYPDRELSRLSSSQVVRRLAGPSRVLLVVAAGHRDGRWTALHVGHAVHRRWMFTNVASATLADARELQAEESSRIAPPIAVRRALRNGRVKSEDRRPPPYQGARAAAHEGPCKKREPEQVDARGRTWNGDTSDRIS
jgi:hypothetical protein